MPSLLTPEERSESARRGWAKRAAKRTLEERCECGLPAGACVPCGGTVPVGSSA